MVPGADTAGVTVPPDPAARVGHIGLGSRSVPHARYGSRFDRIEYRNFSLVVLNLRAPSLLLGFQLEDVGHKFLAPYRVSMDLEQSELRFEKF